MSSNNRVRKMHENYEEEPKRSEAMKDKLAGDSTRVILDGLANVGGSIEASNQRIQAGMIDLKESIRAQDALHQRQSDNLKYEVETVKNLIQTQASQISCLKDEVDALRKINEKLQVEVNESKQLLLRSPPQQDQSIVKGLNDVQSQVAALILSLNSKSARKAMKQFNYSLHKYVTEPLNKFKDAHLEKAVSSMLETIVQGWQAQSNTDSDLDAMLTSVYNQFVKDFDNFMIVAANKRGRVFTTDWNVVISDHLPVSKYLPDAKANNDKVQQTTVSATQTTNSQAASVSISKGQQPAQVQPAALPKPTLYYDFDEKEVLGVLEYINQSFPLAQRLPNSSSSVKQPCMIVSFIVVHDRMDMTKWIPLSQERAALSGNNHYVVLVCNRHGDAVSLTTDKLVCKAMFKTFFSVHHDMTGTGKPAKQIFEKNQLEPARQLKGFFQAL